MVKTILKIEINESLSDSSVNLILKTLKESLGYNINLLNSDEVVCIQHN